MPRFLLTRRWIAIHLLALLIAGVCLALGLWQLDRLQDRREVNARVEAQANLDAVDLDRLLPTAGASPKEQRAAEFRMAVVRGTYDMSAQVILQSRTFKGRPGNHLLTPVVLSSGEAVVIDRGWVPLPTDEDVLTQSDPPPGTITLIGQVLPPEDKAFFGVSDPPPGKVGALPRVDLERLGGQLPYPLYPLYIRLQDQTPQNAGALPEPVPLPPQGEGPHLEYMAQWFLFGGMALVIYLGLVRREVGRHRAACSEAEESQQVTA